MVATIYGLDDAPSNDDQNNFVGEIVLGTKEVCK